MRYLSVCSGIEAATVAWHPLGWTPAAFSEIEAFPRAVLAHHYPSVPCHGDFTTIGADEYGPIDLLVGGTPCQSFSVAGLRGGLADERGNLALEYLRLADRIGARWLVWENVPGVLSSSGGRDFGAFLGGLAQLGYGFAYRVLDAQFFGVPQRRRRVFVVGYLGDWRRAAAVLFERHSLSGHPAPRREKRQTAPTIPSRSTAGGGLGTDFDCDGGLIAADVCGTLSGGAHPGGLNGQDAYTGQLVTYAQPLADPITANEQSTYTHEGTGNFRTRNVVAIQERATSENPDAGPDGAGFRDDGAAYTLEARTVPQAVAFSAKDYGQDAAEELAPTLRSGTHDGSHANGGVMPAVAFQPRIGRNGRGYAEEVVPALNGADAGATSDMRPCIASSAMVRRLTPRECERLQGFPDDYTLIPYRGKPAADGPRYKALGNSMAVPVMRWIGERIQAVESLDLARAA